MDVLDPRLSQYAVHPFAFAPSSCALLRSQTHHEKGAERGRTDRIATAGEPTHRGHQSAPRFSSPSGIYKRARSEDKLRTSRRDTPIDPNTPSLRIIAMALGTGGEGEGEDEDDVSRRRPQQSPSPRTPHVCCGDAMSDEGDARTNNGLPGQCGRRGRTCDPPENSNAKSGTADTIDPNPMMSTDGTAVILFYAYLPLSSSVDLMSPLRDAVRDLCVDLDLCGRVLIGLSDDAEGINGTLAGGERDVHACTVALMGRERYMSTHSKEKAPKPSCEGTNDDDANVVYCESDEDDVDRGASGLLSPKHVEILNRFWDSSQEFASAAGVPVPTIPGPDDFKWSSHDGEEALFPDLNVKLVKEIISTGGALSSIAASDTGRGYLTPRQFHERLLSLNRRRRTGDGKANTDDGGGDDENDDEEAESDTVLIDVRNHKEYSIGHFDGAVDPNTRTFEQFPRWVESRCSRSSSDNYFAGRHVLMYCTGGVRCEKASAFLRRACPDVESVEHLKGGIHKYLEEYGTSGLFRGKNFVFDRRGADDPASSRAMARGGDETSGGGGDGGGGVVVGRCLYCGGEWDTFTPGEVCTVCREPTLVCPPCRSSVREYHCDDHQNLRECYFTDLTGFSREELEGQLERLEERIEEIAVGRKFRQRRKTLVKQVDRVRERLVELEELEEEAGGSCSDGRDGGATAAATAKCRNCGSDACTGNCWGFHGLGRRERLLAEEEEETSKRKNGDRGPANDARRRRPRKNRQSASQRISKIRQRERDIDEVRRLHLSAPPSVHRDPATSLRCPPPCTRVLRTTVKGRWFSRSVSSVLTTEFPAAFPNDEDVRDAVGRGLVTINDVPVSGAEVVLRNGDVIGRVLHWHEPPVLVPDVIGVTRVPLPRRVVEELLPSPPEGRADDQHDGGDSPGGGGGDGGDEGARAHPRKQHFVYCIDKPSTVPVHPAGPYLSNTLTMMVEAQEEGGGLETRSLRPCHRLDRATSGLTLCCTDSGVANLVQSRMMAGSAVGGGGGGGGGSVSKLYVARVAGKFPSSKSEIDQIRPIDSVPCGGPKSVRWRGIDDDDNDATEEAGEPATSCVEVCAPVATIDPAVGLRAVRCANGKPSVSRFRLLSYDGSSDTSLISCSPLTGRGHQLRVHLGWIGHPVWDDVQYGGVREVADVTSVKSSRSMREMAVEAVIRAARVRDGSLDSTVGVSDAVANAARDACKCCSGRLGVEASFDRSQLLDGGHSIALHALRYKVHFDRSRKRRKEPSMSTGGSGSLATLEFSTKLPSWANGVREDGIVWLNTLKCNT